MDTLPLMNLTSCVMVPLPNSEGTKPQFARSGAQASLPKSLTDPKPKTSHGMERGYYVSLAMGSALKKDMIMLHTKMTIDT